ncbi:RNA-directed DNA polymerase, eukaryota, reverse transcriptase zinc-binding domain protein [Tanacetum coccineum]
MKCENYWILSGYDVIDVVVLNTIDDVVIEVEVVITEGTKKIVDVEYSWIPCICSHYKVFGHIDNVCKSKSNNGIDDGSVKTNDNEFNFKVIHNRKYGREGFNMNRKPNMHNGQFNRMRNVRGHNQWQINNKFEYRKRKEDEGKGVLSDSTDDNEGIDAEDDGLKTSNMQTSGGSRNTKDTKKGSQKGSTSVDNSNRSGILGSNRFTLLNSLINKEDLSPNIEQRMIVDEFLTKKIKGNEDVMEEECDEGSNVLRNEVEGVGGVGAWNIRGLCSHSDKQKEVKRFIKEEELQFCAVLETHVKYKNIKKTCGNVFGNWECITNGEDNNKGCKIMVGWNANMIQAWLISQSRQYMFLPMETIDKKSKFFCTMIYASNSGMERKKLWYVNTQIEVLTLQVKWLNFKSVSIILSTLKKLDRIMVNEDFIDRFQQAHGIFLPYMIFDHSPIVVNIPNGVQKRKGSFRLSNFITDKKDFLPTLKNGNAFENVEKLRLEVKKCQNDVDKFPHNESIKVVTDIVKKDINEAKTTKPGTRLERARKRAKDRSRKHIYL